MGNQSGLLFMRKHPQSESRTESNRTNVMKLLTLHTSIAAIFPEPVCSYNHILILLSYYFISVDFTHSVQTKIGGLESSAAKQLAGVLKCNADLKDGEDYAIQGKGNRFSR
jgi:hypothetical protein